MTQQHVRTNPRYIEIDGPTGLVDLATSSPPFEFRGVTSRVFPIKANMSQLYRFCDRYLNMDVPDTIVQFRPALPYVYLMVINYGSMAASSAKGPSVGWVAQREVTFTVALERWVRDKETQRLRFVDWATVTPFIFVDDELSLITGREVYGWPKVAAEIEPSIPLWASDPGAPTRLFTLKTAMFPKLFGGAREEMMDLIDIERDSVPRFSEAPPDLDNPWNPLWILPTAAASSLGLMGQAADLLLRLPSRGYRDGWSLASLLGMSRAAALNMASALPAWAARLPTAVIRRLERELGSDTGDKSAIHPKLGMNTITLKQFRDTHDPNQACYQALVSARMTIEQINRCGLLGDYNFLRGDPSGGYSIRLHRSDAQPIVQCLGLEVERTERGGLEKVDVLKPVLPFWTDVNLNYDVGKVICSRAQCSHPDERCAEWHSAESTCTPTANASHHTAAAKSDGKMFYNTLQGAATQAVTGPFHFPDMTVQIYPLHAKRMKLKGFLDGYLNTPLAHTGDPSPASGFAFEVHEPYVYLMASVLGDKAGIMWSESNNIGWWADKEVSVCMLVKVFRLERTAGTGGKVSERRTFAGLGLVYPYVFSNSSRAVITDRETVGRPTVRAEIESPADVWMTPGGPVAPRQLLTLRTDVFPSFYLGQEAAPGTLIEVCEQTRDPLGTPAIAARTRKSAPRPALKNWLDGCSNSELDAWKGAHSRGSTVIRYHIKQYRDSKQIETACYQALVKTRLQISEPELPHGQKNCGRIDNHPLVRLAQTPAFPIALNLGLSVADTSPSTSGVMQSLLPVDPFWIRVKLRERLGQVLCWRTEQGPWSARRP